ncbi:MAG: KH domain-containing protein [Candidatus Saccharibacteria bacterium]
MSSIDEQFVEFIVKSLVGNPDAVKIERRIDEKGVLLELTVDPEDLGRVIGKRGATAQSLRTLLRALGTKNDARYNLKIVDNGEPRPRREDDQSSYGDSAHQDSAPAPQSSEVSETNSWNTSVADNKEDDDLFPSKTDDSSSSSRAEQTRKELEDLDDLDL